MGKHLFIAKAKCPLYRGERPQVVRCGESVTENWKVFPDRAEWTIHKEMYCYSENCKQCPNYITIQYFEKLSPSNKDVIMQMLEKMGG